MAVPDTSHERSGPDSVRVVVNGLSTQAHVDRRLMDETLLPALIGAAEDPRPDRRRFAFLVGPPGVGKSTLATLLAERARRREPAPMDLEAVGIDGFHHPNSYLSTHHLPTATGSVSLSAVKGAPETFDVESLTRYLEQSARQDLAWPTYDRRVHDVVPGREPLSAGLVLVEGNWLLLDEPGWRDLAAYASFVIFLTADPELLRDRLVERKVRGGLARAVAEAFYDRSDRHNVDRVLSSSDLSKVDLMLRMQDDGTIQQGDLS